MSGNKQTEPLRHIAWRIVAAFLLTGISLRAPLAQQAGAGGSAHGAAPGERNGGNASIGLLAHRPAGQGSNIQAPQFLKIVPGNNKPAAAGRANAAERNGVGMPGAGHNAATVGTHLGPVAAPGAAVQSGGGLAARGGYTAPGRVPSAQPLVSSRATIGGPSSSGRPGAALLPLGGPAKPAATGINGTSIRPKH